MSYSRYFAQYREMRGCAYSSEALAMRSVLCIDLVNEHPIRR